MLKHLTTAIPDGFLVDAKWFGAHGYSRQLLHHYVTHGWLVRVAQGLYRRPIGPSETADRPGWLLQVASAQWMGYQIHVGATTALELQGYVHYVPLGGSESAYLYSASAPSWMKRLDVDSELRMRSLKLFNGGLLGLDSIDLGGPVRAAAAGRWSPRLTLSTLERAVLEALDELPEHEGFGALDAVFGSLTGLRPRLLTELLKACRSVKVKRLFFVMADRHEHAWRKYLDVADFDLGSGDRQLVKGGRMHPTYRITVPADLAPLREGEGGRGP